ncbi:MAG TPA: histidinol dehydrogenase, partial [Candidatus Limnocylindrales bacterium]|nr:histidinol dehydrogenase [Candidatus Limnocylindrales bacterium]
LARAAEPQVAAEIDRLVRRGAVPDPAVREAARSILHEVRVRGDAAVRAANEAHGGGSADGRLLADPADLRAARDALPRELRAALEKMIEHVRRFHEPQLPRTTRTVVAPGIEIERRWTPLSRVGAYVPGGSAAYPSSLVMCAVPARVAGVGNLVVATPARPEGRPSAALLGCAGLLEVDALVIAGGAQAVGALAFGLPEAGLAPVERIVGPGNAWVTAAKLEVFGQVGIDLPAGPSEVLVLADATADPAHVAADLLSQAEHGPDSPAILVTADAGLAEAVEAELARQLERAPRRATLTRSLAAAGLLVLAPDLDSAVAFSEAYAPEHLTVVLADAESAVARIRSAGSIFVGPFSPESAGDYASGANHVLPTGGLARSSGALSVEDFGHFVQVQRLTRDGLGAIRETVTTLAAAEGLAGHAEAVEVRFRAAATTGAAASPPLEPTEAGRA